MPQCLILIYNILPKPCNTYFHSPSSSWTGSFHCSLCVPHIVVQNGYLSLLAFGLKASIFEPVQPTITTSVTIYKIRKFDDICPGMTSIFHCWPSKKTIENTTPLVVNYVFSFRINFDPRSKTYIILSSFYIGS